MDKRAQMLHVCVPLYTNSHIFVEHFKQRTSYLHTNVLSYASPPERQCVRNSYLLLIFHPITEQLCHQAVIGWNIGKGGFFSESTIRFSNLQISKKKSIPKNYPELEI